MTRLRFDWTNFLFVIAAHLLAAFAIVYLAVFCFSWWTIGFSLVWAVMCGLSITGGYHRLFSHRSYKASPLLRATYLAFGSAAVQNSALSWSADHRAHHANVDRDEDPYNIRRGFWWAHIGWVVFRNQRRHHAALVRDLEADLLVRLQHRYYVPLAILFGALVPGAIGLAWGDPLGAMLVAGWLRLVVQWHATFSVNSFAHWLGRQPYTTRNSSRDSFLVALMTFGEGYHNFHHCFQVDYRNGVRWYHFDPTKWWVWTASKLGLARDLRRIPKDRVIAARQSVQQTSPG